MNIHEYQAKSLLQKFGVAVPKGGIAYTPQEAEKVAGGLPGAVYVVKSQIHAGGRGAGRFKDDPTARAACGVVKSPAGGARSGGGDARPRARHQADRAQGPRGASASMSKRAATSSASSISACWSTARPRASP